MGGASRGLPRCPEEQRFALDIMGLLGLLVVLETIEILFSK